MMEFNLVCAIVQSLSLDGHHPSKAHCYNHGHSLWGYQEWCNLKKVGSNERMYIMVDGSDGYPETIITFSLFFLIAYCVTWEPELLSSAPIKTVHGNMYVIQTLGLG